MAATGSSDIPYVMWDKRLSEAHLREELAHGTPARRIELLARIMRDARGADVWRYRRREDIVAHRDELFARLGWRKPLWVFLYTAWIAHGVRAAQPDTERGPARRN